MRLLFLNCFFGYNGHLANTTKIGMHPSFWRMVSLCY